MENLYYIITLTNQNGQLVDIINHEPSKSEMDLKERYHRALAGPVGQLIRSVVIREEYRNVAKESVEIALRPDEGVKVVVLRNWRGSRWNVNSVTDKNKVIDLLYRAADLEIELVNKTKVASWNYHRLSTYYVMKYLSQDMVMGLDKDISKILISLVKKDTKRSLLSKLLFWR